MDILNKLKSGDKRAAARLITMAENNDPQATELIKALFEYTGRAKVIGITGPPGAGKSTLTDKLVKSLRKKGFNIGVIAVDPTSPFTGGAILGDRVRMQDLATDPGVFIRSMGTRGYLGGLSKATQAALRVLDIYGADFIFIETVGVGQSEIDIVKIADTTVMVMVPGLGDDIQAIKAGIMEIGDVFAVNKSDRDGAERTVVEIEHMLDFNHDTNWRPPVNKVIATQDVGIEGLINSIFDHINYLETSGLFMANRKAKVKEEIVNLTKDSLMSIVMSKAEESALLEHMLENIMARKLDPYTAVNKIVEDVRK